MDYILKAMDYVLRMMDFVVRMMDFVLRMMDFVLKMMDFVLRMMDFVLKMMDFVQKSCIAPCCHQKIRKKQYCNLPFLKDMGLCFEHVSAGSCLFLILV